MMKTLILTAAAFAVAAGTSFGFDTPPTCNGTQQQIGRRDGTGRGARQGKRTGPQDGSGPIHTPGTGGGTGAGRRAGRR